MSAFTHIWHIPFEGLPSTSLATLNQQEKYKASKFRKEEDRQRYILSHTYLRKILTYYFPEVQEEAWEFSVNDYYKPSISPKHNCTLHFNLSHTGSRLCIICSNAFECGIDAEEIKDMELSEELLSLVLSKEEQNDFEKSKQQESIFFKYWTLKEAHVKAKGKGVYIDLNSVVFKNLEEKSSFFVMDKSLYYSECFDNEYYLSFTVLGKDENKGISFYGKEVL